MLVLALDTALAACQAAVVDTDDDAPVIRRLDDARGQAEAIAALADDALAGAGVALRDIDRIAVTVGPGSFTGVRVALAYARGLSLALEAPVIGVGTLDALAREAADVRTASAIVGVVDARHGAVYARCYDGAGAATNEPRHMALEQLADEMPADAVVIGNAADRLAASASPGQHPTAVLQREAVDLFALARCAAALRPPFQRAQPLYLREPDAAVSLRARVERR